MFALTLAALLVIAFGIAVKLATTPSRVAPRIVTIPLADRSASRALLEAAEAVGFEPLSEPGVGQVEDSPISNSSPASAADLLPAGSLAPRFTLRTPTGAAVGLAGLRGRAVLLEFFATWCPECDAEAPHLARLSESLRGSRYAFLAVNADGETAPSVLAYHIYFGLEFPALLDPSSHPGSFHTHGSAGAVSRAYRVQSFPTFYVLDPRGRIVWAAAGEQPDLLLRDELRRAAASAPPVSG